MINDKYILLHCWEHRCEWYNLMLWLTLLGKKHFWGPPCQLIHRNKAQVVAKFLTTWSDSWENSQFCFSKNCFIPPFDGSAWEIGLMECNAVVLIDFPTACLYSCWVIPELHCAKMQDIHCKWFSSAESNVSGCTFPATKRYPNSIINWLLNSVLSKKVWMI